MAKKEISMTNMFHDEKGNHNNPKLNETTTILNLTDAFVFAMIFLHNLYYL